MELRGQEGLGRSVPQGHLPPCLICKIPPLTVLFRKSDYFSVQVSGSYRIGHRYYLDYLCGCLVPSMMMSSLHFVIPSHREELMEEVLSDIGLGSDTL